MSATSRPARYEDSDLRQLAAAIPAAANDQDRWQSLAAQLAQTFASPRCHIVIVHRGENQFLFSAGYGLTAQDIAAYEGFWRRNANRPMEELDPWTRYLQERPRRVLNDADILLREDYESSAFYREVLAPAQANHSLTVAFPLGEGGHGAFAVMRGPDRGPYDAEDAAALEQICPSFCCAMEAQYLAL
jgi:hypothetical protein